MTAPGPDDRPRSWLGLPPGVWIAVLAAFVVRALFLADKPFWRDEGWVVLIASDPLAAGASGRASPVGFLWLTRLVVSAVPFVPEVSYRLAPLAAGVGAVAALARWALSLGASRAAATAVAWLAAGVPPLVYYSREVKSYEFDFLLAIVAPMAAAAAFPAAQTGAARAAFAMIVVAAPWLSFGGIFAVGAVFAWGWIAWWRDLDRAGRRWWLAATALFLASFGAVYVLALGAQSGDRWMHQYWSYYLVADRRLWLPVRLARALWEYASIATTYFFPLSWPVAVPLALAGAWSWPRATRSQLVVLFVATAGACATAAVLERYLLVSGRLLLFAAPIPLLWIANGLVVVAARAGARGLAVAAAVAISLWWSGEAIRWRVGKVQTRQSNFFRYDVLQDVDIAIEAAARLIPDGEPLLVSRAASYAFRIYYDGEPLRAAFWRRDERAGADQLAKQWLRRVERRAWVLLTDEELRWAREILAAEGFTHRERAAVRGARLWEVRRRNLMRTGATRQGTSEPPRPPARPARR